MAMEHLYRYRNTHSLLDGYQELEKQEIFFASADDLNDPMEGFRDIFWQGDEVSWRNLFKHYISCLQHVYMLVQIGGPQYHLDKSEIPIQDPRPDYKPELNATIDHTAKIFFESPGLSQIVDALAKRTIPVRAIELTDILESIQGIALLSIQKSFHDQQLGPPPTITGDPEQFPKSVIQKLNLLNTFGETKKINEEQIWALDLAGENATMQLKLANQYNGIIDPTAEHKNLLAIDFPGLYVEQLGLLVHPPWYAACFMESAKNSSAWGHYAGNHSGVCLKFSVKNKDGRKSLSLHSRIGYDMKGPIYGDVDHEFQKVSYELDHLSIDFFHSIAHIPIPIANRDWRYFEGRPSKFATDNVGSSEENRSRYWRDFSASLCIKTPDWAPEQEHRIILDGSFNDYSDPKTRALKYRFEDLDGIIFGIRTTTSDKLKIMKIIEEKCRAESRKTFNFYQAYYSRRTKTIECSHLSLLKFKHAE